MQTIAIMKAAPVSDQKARLVADQVRGLPVAKALNLLTFSPKKSAVLIKKVLESAIANAEHNDGADIDELKVTSIYVDKPSSCVALPLVQRAVALAFSNKPVTFM